MAKKKQVPELKVLFDTNILFTKAASDLVKPEVASLIKENSSYIDHQVSWFMPDIVRHERQYQMLRAGKELLPSIAKVEKLLGHNLAITEAILEERVKHVVSTQLSDLNIKLVEVDTSKVDWEKLMLSAVYRRPPFDSGEKEKGFRDAIVLESFVQLIGQSPVTPKVCRIVLVTEDKLLIEAATSVISNNQNVRVLNTLEELRGLINTLVSEVDEDFVEEVRNKAGNLFFAKDDKSSLYYKEGLREQIKEQFSIELNTKPENVTESEADTWYISNPRFVKKVGQRFYWASRIEPTFNGYKTELKATPSNIFPQGAESAIKPTGLINSLSTLLTSTEKKLVAKYGVIFEVDWSVTYGQNKKFSSTKIEGIRFIEIQQRSDE